MKLLVTRAAEPAWQTAEKLAAAGQEPVLLPLAEYRDTGAPIPDRSYSAIAFTSAVACDTLARRGGGEMTRLVDLPAFCVGEATAAAARRAGWQSVEGIAPTAGDLAELLRTTFGGTSGAILYPAARDRAHDLTSALAPAGFTVETVVVYAAELIDPGPQALSEALDEIAGGGVLLYSERMARHLFELVSGHGLDGRIRGLTFIAISENVARAVPRGFDVRVAAEPNEKAMLALPGGRGESGEDFPGTDNGKGE